jgi:hypothetical protein
MQISMGREDTDFDAIRTNLQVEIERQAKLLAKLQRAYAELAPEDNSRAGKYARMRVWQAVREYLRSVGEASVTDILNELSSGGAALGKYPLRTVRIAITSPYMKDTFHVQTVGNDDVVSLREQDGRRGSTDKSPPTATPGKRPDKAASTFRVSASSTPTSITSSRCSSLIENPPVKL